MTIYFNQFTPLAYAYIRCIRVTVIEILSKITRTHSRGEKAQLSSGGISIASESSSLNFVRDSCSQWSNRVSLR